MFGKRMRFVTMIGAAAGIPYAWNSPELNDSVKNGWESATRAASSWTSSASSSMGHTTWPIAFATSSFASRRDSDAPALSHSVTDLSQVLRFDVTQRWITERWSRVSTFYADRDLVGLRVPLVTGTDLDDFAGSLTYYFNADGRLVRITVHGHTGDDRQLVRLVTQQFGLRPEPSIGAGIYLFRWNTRPVNVMRVTHAPVIRSDEPFTKFAVELELNDAGAGCSLSDEFAALLLPDQHVRRW